MTKRPHRGSDLFGFCRVVFLSAQGEKWNMKVKQVPERWTPLKWKDESRVTKSHSSSSLWIWRLCLCSSNYIQEMKILMHLPSQTSWNMYKINVFKNERNGSLLLESFRVKSRYSVGIAVQQHLLLAYISWLIWGTPWLKWELGIASPDLLPRFHNFAEDMISSSSPHHLRIWTAWWVCSSPFWWRIKLHSRAER